MPREHHGLTKPFGAPDLAVLSTVLVTTSRPSPTATATVTAGGDLYALAELQAELWRGHANRRESTRALGVAVADASAEVEQETLPALATWRSTVFVT